MSLQLHKVIRETGVKKILGIILGTLLTVAVVATPVLANPPTLSTVIDNLQYSERQDSDPWFRCCEMSIMSFRFFDVAGYRPVLVLGFDTIAVRYSHMWVESPQFDSGMYYEATAKTMAPLSDLNRFTERYYYYTEDGYDDYYWNHLHELVNAQSPKSIQYWENWYDWQWTRGDMSDDGVVDLLDFVLFADVYGAEVTEVDYAMLGDMDLDGDVDIFDFVLFADVYERRFMSRCER